CAKIWGEYSPYFFDVW
nr:immunoglobulin heavy chain junction region [Macaca mulatta]MOY30207.1 immunoglobulin heavy chain junction region [Macaca mulatta]